jgi:hypothetical protein
MLVSKIIWFCILMTLAITSQSCLESEKIDMEEARKLVYLDAEDLATFSELRSQLIKDSTAIRRDDERVNNFNHVVRWFTTNSYYLDQIDSLKYERLFDNLKGKMEDDILIDSSGVTIFTIKHRTQHYLHNYQQRYTHSLISTDCKYPLRSIIGGLDSVFIDSAINKDWRYVFHKALTGH